MKHAHAMKLMDKAFAEALSKAERAELSQHLDGCDSCRARYDRLARSGMAARAVAKGEETISPELDQGRLERMSQEFLADMGPAQAPEQSRSLFALPRWLAAGAAAAVLAIGFAVIWSPAKDDTLISRGGEVDPQREELVGLRLFALSPEQQIRDLNKEALQGAPLLAAGTALKLAYTNLDDRVQHLSVCAIAQDGSSAVVLPADQRVALGIDRSVTDRPLPGQIRLDQFFAPGKIRLVALFSEQPIDQAELQRALDERASSAEPTGDARLEGLGQVLQDSLLLELAPAPEAPEDGGSEG